MDQRGRTFFLSPLLPPFSESTYSQTSPSSSTTTALESNLVDTMHLFYHREYLARSSTKDGDSSSSNDLKRTQIEENVNKELQLLASWQRAIQDTIQPQRAILSSLSSPPPFSSSSSSSYMDMGNGMSPAKNRPVGFSQDPRSHWAELRLPSPHIQVCPLSLSLFFFLSFVLLDIISVLIISVLCAFILGSHSDNQTHEFFFYASTNKPSLCFLL